MIPKEESQQVEFKSIWKDEYLKQICGFANSQGGSIYLGVNDHGIVVGIQNTKRLLEEIPNKGANLMGIVLQVDLLSENSLQYFYLKCLRAHSQLVCAGNFMYGAVQPHKS